MNTQHLLILCILFTTITHLTAMENNSGINEMKSIILERAETNYHDCLRDAARCGFDDVLETLLLRSKDKNDVNTKFGWDKSTCLHYAATKGHCKVVKLLLDKGADMHAQDVAEATPLHLACDHGRVETVKILIQYGANVNALSHCYGTPLHSALISSNLLIAQVLLDANADYTIVNSRGFTPLHDGLGDSRTVRFIKEHLESENNEWMAGLDESFKKEVAIVKFLLEHDTTVKK